MGQAGVAWFGARGSGLVAPARGPKVAELKSSEAPVEKAAAGRPVSGRPANAQFWEPEGEGGLLACYKLT